MFSVSVKNIILNIIISILSISFAMILYHFYHDHKLVDAVRNDIIQRQSNNATKTSN